MQKRQALEAPPLCSTCEQVIAYSHVLRLNQLISPCSSYRGDKKKLRWWIRMTRARDVGVVIIAVAAAFIALQGTPDVAIQLRWIIGGQATGGSEHQRMYPLPIPQPLVTDLDGDGKSEVVMVSDDRMTVRVLSIPHALAETLVDPVVLHEKMVAPHAHAPGERHIVAMAAGDLDSPTLPRSTSGLKQHLVIVREDRNVICYDHTLKKKWKVMLPHDGSPVEGGSFVMDQVAIVVTQAASEVDSQGRPNQEVSTGSVVIGVSMRHRGGHHHARAARGPADASRSDGNPLGVHVEAFEGGEDSRDEQEEAEMSEEEKQRRAAEHFSIFRLDALNGEIVWSHIARGHHEDQDMSTETDTAIRRPHYKLEELDDLSRPVDDQRSGRGSGARRYRRSLLHLLPHAWSSSVDTRLEVAVLYRHGPNGKGSGEGLGRQGMRHSSSGRGKPSTPNEDGRGRAEARGTGGGAVQAVVARTREGLEAVELSTGRPLGSVALPAAPSGAGGVYADLNGDGVVDHVQAVGTQGVEGWGHLYSALATKNSPSEARQPRRLPPCYALAVSGLPPREQLFNGSICHDGGALLEMGERLSKANSRLGPRSEGKVGASVPAVLPRGVPSASATYSKKAGMTGGGGAKMESRSDVVFAVSSGVISCYDDEGRLKWQDRRGPKWGLSEGKSSKADNGDDDNRGYVIPFRPEVTAGGGNAVDSFLDETRILVMGNDKICVYDLDGRLSGQAPLISAPSQPPVVGDFDGNGIVDVVVLGRSGLAAGYALAPDPGIRILFVAVLVLIGAILIVAAVYVPPPGGRKGPRGQGSVVWKTKRATD